jgi:mRNA-degrading endonuclease toxin of MazEF toxin-antitoxin module
LIIAPLTGTDRHIPAHLRLDVGVAGLTKTSFLLCDQIRTISERRFMRQWGEMPADVLLLARQIAGRFIDAQYLYS